MILFANSKTTLPMNACKNATKLYWFSARSGEGKSTDLIHANLANISEALYGDCMKRWSSHAVRKRTQWPFWKAASLHMSVMHVLCGGDLDRTFAVPPFLSIARIDISLEKNIPDGDKPSSVACRVSALGFGTPQAMIAASSMPDKSLHEIRPTWRNNRRQLGDQFETLPQTGSITHQVTWDRTSPL
jgi:hypothetical protein